MALRDSSKGLVLDGPATTHLLDNKFGIEPGLDLGRGVNLRNGAQSLEQSGVLGHIVGRYAQMPGQLNQDIAGRCLADNRSIGGRPWVAA